MVAVVKTRKERLDAIRIAAENDLYTFAKLVQPNRMYGHVHEEMFRFWTREKANLNQLALVPRAHQKSHCAAVYAAWMVIKQPWITILYVSATADLAEKQLYAIKNILDSKIVKRYWPELLDPDEGKREKWAVGEICVDHPERKAEGVRDPTVKASGLTSGITGFHADAIFIDDAVTPNNAYTTEGRKKVEMMYSQLASIKNSHAKTVIVGTRYHPKDLYATVQETMLERFKEGMLISSKPLYELFFRVVEEDEQFIWPTQTRKDGRTFGFDENVLAHKRAEYLDKTQFKAQYYNDPNDPENARIKRDTFQYYTPKHVSNDTGRWAINGNRLNVYAAIDFAFTLGVKSDYTSIVVVGVDSDRNYYVMDITRFKTSSIKVYFDEILAMYTKWGFKKLRAEISAAQEVIVEDLKQSYIIPNGLSLSVDTHKPTAKQGSKEERMMAILEPKYNNGQMWHYRSGYCQVLEEELTQENPPHDDCMDALSAAIDVSTPPARTGFNRQNKINKAVYSSRFGGVSGVNYRGAA